MTLTKKLFTTAALVVATAAVSAAPALANAHATAPGPDTVRVRTGPTVGPDNGHITSVPLESRAG
ncbi:hypothetical protein OG204_15285 [Streptomyces sp. NBC_01387]|uniref:hypothetical protein n=1 Tax=unclassified Streptomyces TaxID=2593676 RepID=UPI002024C42F|nr:MULTISPECIES: hypothetical protein [unclassified Streptomyces]MCX4550261.1 hypothetical protein [Streptomyces sp. NBC_01500]WSC21756.1 hypothetical protein OIE60_19870 [Streptomyces sp. NBC_01766]